jgi:hypothetical protein
MYLSQLVWLNQTQAKLLLEHPADPAMYSWVKGAELCASIWQTKAVRAWIEEVKLATITFDQCRLGQIVPKTTTVATNLPLSKWNKLFCNHSQQEHMIRIEDSSTLSRWPWEMNMQISVALSETVGQLILDQNQVLPKLSLEKHVPSSDKAVHAPTWQQQIDSQLEMGVASHLWADLPQMSGRIRPSVHWGIRFFR